jgi:hypothetical protein
MGAYSGNNNNPELYLSDSSSICILIPAATNIFFRFRLDFVGFALAR